MSGILYCRVGARSAFIGRVADSAWIFRVSDSDGKCQQQLQRYCNFNCDPALAGERCARKIPSASKRDRPGHNGARAPLPAISAVVPKLAPPRLRNALVRLPMIKRFLASRHSDCRPPQSSSRGRSQGLRVNELGGGRVRESASPPTAVTCFTPVNGRNGHERP